VLFANFVCTLCMYLTSLAAVLRTPSPSAVVRRASWRALAYPCGFLITAFPEWLLYARVIPEDLWLLASGRDITTDGSKQRFENFSIFSQW
ncbi:unnamed protein product, partial [Symbiodinium pilosum]